MARILVVDDEKSIRITLRAFLLEADYEVGVAEDAEEALGMLAAQDFDVVLSDIIMPRMTGVRLLQSITETAPHAQVILMTGEPTVETASEAVRAKAFDYLSKPIGKEQLLRTVANAVKVKTLDDERRRLEEENRRYREDLEHLVEERTKALKQSEARLVRAQAIVHMGNWVWDLEANTQHWSDEVYRVFGLEPRSIKPRFEAFLRMVHPDDREYVQRRTKDVLAQREDSGTEYRIIRPDGEVRTLWTESIVSFDETGKPIRVEGMMMDITRRRQAEKELVKAKEHAEEMNRLKSAFLANMSHEFRTPLAGIIGFATILAQEVPEQLREDVRHIEQSGQRLLDTLSSVLDLSMLEAGSLPLDSEIINVADEVQQQVALLRPLAEQKGLPLRILAPPIEVNALLDRAGLARLLNHLVGNAIKFTTQGEVAVEVRPVAEHVEIRVVDTGVGMSADFLPRLFDAFKQESTGTARLYEGAGLGLTITKKLVSLMEGTITVESEEGRGSTFTVSFPRIVSSAVSRKRDARPAIARKRPAIVRKGPGHPAARQDRVPPRVLAVDDTPSMLLLLERYLEPYAVDTARTEEKALTLARQQLYDVVLLDINLGCARDGVDVLRELRMLPGYERVPTVAVTAYAMPGDKERFLEAGFDAYLGKPFTEEELHEVLVQLLALHSETF